MFPDAPTQRGVKHLHHLIQAVKEGFRAYLVFVVQMEGMTKVIPNHKTHPDFAQALSQAHDAGVNILAYGCRVRPDSLIISEKIQVALI